MRYHCHRCGSMYYDGDFRQKGCRFVEWMRSVKWRFKQRSRYRFHRCDVCQKPLYFTDQDCCSPQCYDKWIPF